MKIINLFAGPGSGKSTTAAGLFFLMKTKGYRVELVTEYAKDMTYEKRFNILADQLYILAKQNRKITRLINQVDFIITDSPILLGLIYDEEKNKLFIDLVWKLFNEYDNYNYFINRVKKYAQYGRNQVESEAREIDFKIRDLIAYLPFKEIDGDDIAPSSILEDIERKINI